MKKRFNLAVLVFLVALIACNQPEQQTTQSEYTTLRGQTMGTTYNVKYKSSENYQVAIDDLLVDINREVNTYDPNSSISMFNELSQVTFQKNEGQHFGKNFDAAQKIYKTTNGYFDPTVMPLVSYWGFGKNKKPVESADDVEIKKRLASVGLENIKIVNFTSNTGDSIAYQKINPNTQLDFSAIAKGYGVDAVGELLKSKGINDFLVEIGGETVTNGKNPRGESWTLGINTPTESANPQTDFKVLVQLDHQAIATSGNYRNYYEVNGQKYAHTINPKTGYPEKSNLLSASVVTSNCMNADAFATAFMVMGLEKALTLAEQQPNMEAYFIYDDNGEMRVKMTTGFEALIVTEN